MLPALRNRKPGPRLAFLVEVEPELLAEYLVAFANGDGGTIVLGIDESGRPHGLGALPAGAQEC